MHAINGMSQAPRVQATVSTCIQWVGGVHYMSQCVARYSRYVGICSAYLQGSCRGASSALGSSTHMLLMPPVSTRAPVPAVPASAAPGASQWTA